MTKITESQNSEQTHGTDLLSVEVQRQPESMEKRNPVSETAEKGSSVSENAEEHNSVRENTEKHNSVNENVEKRYSVSSKGRKFSSALQDHVEKFKEMSMTNQTGGIMTQVYGSAISSMGYLAGGIVNYWTGAALSQIDEDFEVGPSEMALIASLATFAGLLSSPLAGTDRIGRRMMLLVSSPLLAAGWIIMGIAPSIYVLMAGRFITGFMSSFMYTACQLYISETTQPSLRGTLGSLTSVFLSVGVIASFSGGFLNWRTSCFLFTAPLIVLFLGMLTLPESPYWYVLKDRKEDAMKGLTYFRESDSSTVEKEIAEMEMKISSVGHVSYKEYLKSRTRNPLLIGMFVYAAQVATGAEAVATYLGKILEATGSTISIENTSMIISSSQLISILISLYLIDKAGRRVLFSTSAMSVGVFSTLLGAYYLYGVYKSFLPGWIAALLCFCILFSFAFGCRSVPVIIPSEIFSTATRATGNAICFSINRLVSTIIVQAFPFLTMEIGYHGVFFLFGFLSAFGAIATYFILPETKGKSLEEIQEYFESTSKKNKNIETTKTGIVNPAMVLEEGVNPLSSASGHRYVI